MKNIILALKVDVDTERGTRIGVPNLLALFKELNIPATFLFSLGQDNTGRAIKRVLRRGFLRKVSRTSVVSTYGLRTLLNGVLLPGPHIGKKHADLLRNVMLDGFEVGIHAYDHQKWQDGVMQMSESQIEAEFTKAQFAFTHIFGKPSRTAGAPGWQANANTLRVYDNAELLYGSDCRGTTPFFPKVDQWVFNTLQLPTTLPTLDELIGRPEFPLQNLSEYYFGLLTASRPNILTIHAELEGMKYLAWFRNFLEKLQSQSVVFKDLETIATECLQKREVIPICEFIQGEIVGRSGTLALQGDCVYTTRTSKCEII